jgi:hypothetical protein
LDVTVEGSRFILGEGIDTADSGIETVGKGEVNDPIDGAERNCGFSPVPGERIESLPSASR